MLGLALFALWGFFALLALFVLQLNGFGFPSGLFSLGCLFWFGLRGWCWLLLGLHVLWLCTVLILDVLGVIRWILDWGTVSSACSVLVQLDVDLVLDWSQRRPSGWGGPGAVWLTELLGTGHGDGAEAVGSFAGVARWDVVWAERLADLPAQGVGSLEAQGLSEGPSNTGGDASVVSVAGATDTDGRRFRAVALDGQADRLRLRQILLQRDRVCSLVGRGDRPCWSEVVLNLVDDRTEVLCRVADWARVQDVRLDVVAAAVGVDDRQVYVGFRGLWVVSVQRVCLGICSHSGRQQADHCDCSSSLSSLRLVELGHGKSPQSGNVVEACWDLNLAGATAPPRSNEAMQAFYSAVIASLGLSSRATKLTIDPFGEAFQPFHQHKSRMNFQSLYISYKTVMNSSITFPEYP